MLKTITLIVFITLTQILAQGSIDTLRSNDKKVQEAFNYYNQKNYEKALTLKPDMTSAISALKSFKRKY